MSTELESFEQFLRDRLSSGDANRSPEEMLRLWRGNGGQQTESAGGDISVESLFDRLSRKKLLATIDGGPADLSTNPTYMEGFGET